MPMEDKLSKLQDRVAELKRKKRSSDKFVKTGKKRNVDHQSAPNSVAGSERFHGLDFLRAMAMLMGLVFHGTYALLHTSHGGWPSKILVCPAPLCHQWRRGCLQ